MARELHDHFFRKAKSEGYLSRAAYKLAELDDRKKLLRRGDRVLDCGCAPGSWLQVAAQRVGPRGFVVGIDLKPVTHRFAEPNVATIVGDLREIANADLAAACGAAPDAPAFDVVLSDMAPNTTGDRAIDHHGSVRLCHAVLDRLGDLLKPGGHCAVKVLEGEAYPELVSRARAGFAHVKGFKPTASRDESTEIYLVMHEFRGFPHDVPVDAPALAPPRPAPRPGWGAPRGA